MRNIKPMPWEKVAGFIFGVIFVITLLALNVFIPNPTPTQYDTFKIVLALAAAGVGGILAGFLHVEGGIDKFKLRAGGALAVFATVFLVTPATPGTPSATQNKAPVIQTNNGTNGTQIGVNQGTLNINNASASQPATEQPATEQPASAQPVTAPSSASQSAASQ